MLDDPDTNPTTLPSFFNPNVKYHEKLQLAIDSMLGQFGPDFPSRPALTVPEGAFTAPLDLAAAKARFDDPAWTEPVLMTGGVNMLWANPLSTLTPNVAIDEDRVLDLMKSTWPDNRVHPINEPLDLLADAGVLGSAQLGNFVRVSADEIQHALIFKVAERIEARADAAELEQWQRVLLSSSGRILKLDSYDAQYFHCTNERRRAKRVAAAVTRLQTQLACEVWMFRARKQSQLNKTLTYQEIADLYRGSLHECDKDEESLGSKRVIEAAIQVYERVLAHEPLRQLLASLDKIYGAEGPFNSFSKLQSLYTKCGSVARMTWVLSLTSLCLRHEKLDISDFAVKKLTSQSGGSKVGTMELILLKHKLLHYLLNNFLDARAVEFKDVLREAFSSPDAYEAKYLMADKTFMSSWPKSASIVADLVENTCYLFNSQETPSLKTAIKMNKTAEELLKEYSPFKTTIEDLDKTIAEERALQPVSALVYDDDGYESGRPPAEASAATTTAAPGAAADAQQASVVEVPEEWDAYVTRYLQKHCHLIVEAQKSQTQLETAITEVNLGKVRGGASGNVILLFDANLWGESITSPHVRRPPVAKASVQKVWKAVQAARAQPEQVGLLPEGDVLCVIDGGRQDESLLQHFSMGGARRKHDSGRTYRDGKTVYRCIMLFFEEKSVKARKYRKRSRHDFVQCTQRAHCFFSAFTKVQERTHKFMPELSNLSNSFGPITLPSWNSLPMLSVQQKKAFWGPRRKAVGGPSAGQSDAEDEADELEEEDEVTPEDQIQFRLPEVGAGRGTRGLPGDVQMPISFHALPSMVSESLVHGFWGISVIDMTPGTGECCKAHILQGMGYLGICQTEEQKDYIIQGAKETF